MTSKQFILRSLSFVFGIYTLYVLTFVAFDDYGLFYKNRGKIYTAESERTSKYLFTYKYIPENFDGVLLGPSLGDQINTQKLQDFKIYNLSVNGANTTELKVLLESVLERKNNIKIAILTLHRYITKSAGLKTSHMVDQEYWASFTSIEAIKYQFRKAFVNMGLAKDYFNAYGYMNMNLAKKHINGNTEARQYLNATEKKDLVVNKKALDDLKTIINLLHQNNIQIIGYFHPDPYYFYQDIEEKSIAYTNTIKNMFRRSDIILDFNCEEYDKFRKNYLNYKDGAHLSYQGEAFILGELNKVLKTIKPM